MITDKTAKLLVTVALSIICSTQAGFTQSAYQLNEDGLSVFSSGRPKESITYFDRGIAIDPTMASLWMNRGCAYDDIGQSDKALQDFAKAISLNPKLGAAYFNRALTYSRMKKWTEALSDLNADIKLRPAHTQAYSLRAAAYMALGKTAESQADFDKVLQLDPENRVALQYRNGAPAPKSLDEELKFLNEVIAKGVNTSNLLKRAQLYYEMKQNDKALADANRLLGMNPGIWEAHLLRAGCYVNLNQNEPALKDLSETLKLKPDQPNALSGRSSLSLRMNRPQEAIADLESLIRQQPKSVGAQTNLGFAFLQIKNFDKAVSAFTTAAEQNPSDAGAYYGRARAYVALNQFQNACDDLDKTLLLKPNYVDAQRLRALARGLLASKGSTGDNAEKALLDYGAVDSNQLSAGDYVLRGFLNKQNGNLKEALQDCTKSIAMKPTAVAYTERANVYMTLSQDSMAVIDLQAALKIDPKEERALTSLGLIYLRQGKFQESAKVLTPLADGAAKDYKVKGLAAVANSYAGNTDVALRLFDGALAEHPDDASLYAMRAECYLRKKDTVKALADANKAIELDPNKQSTAYRIRGTIDLMKNDAHAALKEFDKSVTISPNELFSLSLRAITNQKLGNTEDALTDVNKVLALDPHYVGALRTRSAIYSKTAPEKSIADATTLIEIDPKNPEQYGARATSYLMSDQYANALRDTETGIKLAPRSATLHCMKLTILTKTNDKDGAMRELKELESLKPTGGELFILGKSKVEMGLYETAADDFAKAASADDFKQPMSPYGAILAYLTDLRLGKTEKANSYIQAVATHFAEPTQWPNPIILYFNGKISREKLLEAAMDNDKKTEALAYLGMENNARGHKAEALKDLRWVIERGNKQFTEYDLAIAELSRMDSSFVAPSVVDKSLNPSEHHASTTTAVGAKNDLSTTQNASTINSAPNPSTAGTANASAAPSAGDRQLVFASAEQQQAYLADAKRRIQAHWTSSAAAGPSVSIVFKIGRGGESSDVIVESGDATGTAATQALSAIQRCSPFRTLPPSVTNDIELKATFQVGQPGTIDVSMH